MEEIYKGGLLLWVLVGILVGIYLVIPSIFDILFGMHSNRIHTLIFVPADLNHSMADEFLLVRDSILGVFVIALVVALYAIPVAMMLEACFSKKSFIWKLFWTVFILVLGIIGMFAYWFFGRKNLR
jgi:hypothetical protein